jgi:hypothetical protein
MGRERWECRDAKRSVRTAAPQRTHPVQITQHSVGRWSKLGVATRNETKLCGNDESEHESKKIRMQGTRLSSPGRCDRIFAITTANLLEEANLSVSFFPFLSLSCCAPPTAKNCTATESEIRQRECVLDAERARRSALRTFFRYIGGRSGSRCDLNSWGGGGGGRQACRCILRR